MILRIPIIMSVLLYLVTLTACDISALSGAKATEYLQIKRVEIKKQGGKRCIEQSGTSTQETAVEDERCVRIRFAYPEVSSSKAPGVAEKINAYILKSLLAGLQSESDNDAEPAPTLEVFAQQFIDDYESDPNTYNSWYLDLTADVDYSNRDLLSLTVAEEGYTGGAHSFSGARFYVLDLKKGNPVSLPQLLNAEYQTELNVVGEKAFRAERGLPTGTSLEDEGFWFENNTFQLNDNFGVRQEGLVFLFNPYEVAPYAMGSIEFQIAYEDIKHLIDPKGALAAIYPQ